MATILAGRPPDQIIVFYDRGTGVPKPETSLVFNSDNGLEEAVGLLRGDRYLNGIVAEIGGLCFIFKNRGVELLRVHVYPEISVVGMEYSALVSARSPGPLCL